MNKTDRICKNIFYRIFTLCFSWLMINVLFFNPYFDYKPYIVLPIAAVWFALMFLAFKAVEKHRDFIERNTVKFLVCFFIVLRFTQFVTYNLCGGYPTRDFERVFTGAYNYTITGVIEDPYLDYFYKYPNNMPITIILQFIFRRAHKFGITNFFAVGALFNRRCISAAYLFTFLSVRNAMGTKYAAFAVILLYFCLPLQTYISIFYTDTTSMLFPPLIIYFYQTVGKPKGKIQNILFCIAMGLAVGLGIKIKYSVAIALIAVIIRCVIKFDFKRLAVIAVSSAMGFALVSGVFDRFMYRNILDKDKAYDMSTPFLAWIAMGMQGDGTHSADDNHFIWAQETHEDKVDGAKFLLKARLEYMGPVGYIKFLNEKAVRSFGSGNLDYPNTVSDSPMKQNFMIDILNSQGKYNAVFDNIIQGYHVTVFLMICIGGAVGVSGKDRRLFARQLSSFGMFLFLLLWEAGTRYLLNYYPVFISASLAGFAFVFEKIRLAKNRKN